jgi:hypothetical protein
VRCGIVVVHGAWTEFPGPSGLIDTHTVWRLAPNTKLGNFDGRLTEGGSYSINSCTEISLHRIERLCLACPNRVSDLVL